MKATEGDLSKGPGKRQVKTILLVTMAASLVALPVLVYWTIDRYDMHRRWDLQARYAQTFLFLTSDTALVLGGHWDNETAFFVSNGLVYSDWQLNALSVVDTAHANQLLRISNAIETLRTDTYLQDLNQSARTTLANQLYALGNRIVNAYWNYVNYTYNTTGAGPPFWYSGPAPPDESLLQDAVNIALAAQRK